MLEAVLIIMCTTAAVSIAVMLLGTCVPVRNDNTQANFDNSSGENLYKPVSESLCCILCHKVTRFEEIFEDHVMGLAIHFGET